MFVLNVQRSTKPERSFYRIVKNGSLYGVQKGHLVLFWTFWDAPDGLTVCSSKERAQDRLEETYGCDLDRWNKNHSKWEPIREGK